MYMGLRSALGDNNTKHSNIYRLFKCTWNNTLSTHAYFQALVVQHQSCKGNTKSGKLRIKNSLLFCSMLCSNL